MNAQRASAVIIVAGLAALVVWWRWPAAPAPNSIPLVHVQPPSVPEEAEAPPVIPPSSKSVELPTAPVAEEPPPTPAPTFDPQADLSTAIPDYIRLLQSGDAASLILNYMPPNSDIPYEQRLKIVQLMQADMQTPEGLQSIQDEISELKIIQNSPPIISDNGNRATYTLPANVNGRERVVFVMVNGRWYMY